MSRLKIEDEVSKPGSRRILESGGTYVMVWSKDLNPKGLKEAREELEKQAKSITDDARTQSWSAAYIARLCARHPAVPQDLGLSSYGPVQSVPRWLRSLKQDERPYFGPAHRPT